MLLHHDPDAAAGATGIRAVLGTEWAHQLAVGLHTTGGLLVVGALVAVLLLRRADPMTGRSGWNPARRRHLRHAVLAGWGLNFLGGTMRLYQPDHPGLGAVGEVAWVQVLVLKHLALLAAIGFSLLAVEWGPRPWLARLRAHAAIALVLVLFASGAGAISTGLPLPMRGADDMDPEGGGLHDPDGAAFTWQNATLGLAGATPLTPRSGELRIEVPHATAELHVTLAWTDPMSSVWAEAYGPDGTLRARSGNVTTQSAELTVDKDVVHGTWRIVVWSDRALDERVAVTTRLAATTGDLRVLEETVAIDGGFEINLYMDPGEYFNHTWRLATGDPAIAWDIHSHPDGEVVIHHEGRDTAADGTFTAGGDGIYSIYWQPDVGQSVTLTYRVEGNFTVHSIYR